MEQKWSDFCQNCEKKDQASLQKALLFCDPTIKAVSFQAFDAFFQKNPNFLDLAPDEAKRAAIALMKELFLHDIEPLLPALRAHFGEPFLQTVSAACSENEWHKLLKEQLTALMQLDALCKEGYSQAKRQAFPYLQRLLSPEFASFRDLPRKAEKILTQDFSHLLPQERKVTPEVFTLLKSFFETRVSEVAALINNAKEQAEKQKVREGFQIEFMKMLQSLTYFKDLQADYNKRKGELESEALVDNAALIAEELKRKRKLLQMRMHDAKQTIKRRLFEIFSGISCYKDLAETFKELASALRAKLTELVDAFYSGKITLKEFTSGCQEMVYEHDVVKLRNEMSHRSSRLKDLRDEAYQIFADAQNRRRFFELSPHATEQKEYRDLLLYIRKIKALIEEIENPFIAFRNAFSKDEINYVFRSMWMKVEELQNQKQDSGFAFTLKTPFLKTLDSLEEVVKMKEGMRPQLVSSYERAAFDENDITSIENRFPFCRPLAFFMLVSDSRARQQMLLEACELEEKIASCRRFAKAMQHIKTFEEERVDSILEAFERQHLLEEEVDPIQEWQRYQKRMHFAIALVEEEVLLEIGWQDRHALMDVDAVQLQKILRYALQKAKKEVRAEDSTEVLLEKLSFACHELFDAKLLAACQKNSMVAKTLGLLEALAKQIADVETWLETTRLHVQGPIGASWISECHVLKARLERFEPTFTSRSEIAELIDLLFKEMYKIAEIAHFRAKGEDPLGLEKAYQAFMQKLSLIQTERDEALPFVYLPGYIRFFVDVE